MRRRRRPHHRGRDWAAVTHAAAARKYGHRRPCSRRAAARRVPPWLSWSRSHRARRGHRASGSTRAVMRVAVARPVSRPSRRHATPIARVAPASPPATFVRSTIGRGGRRKEKKERKQREKKKKKMIESCDFANKPSSFGKSHVCVNWKFHVLNPDFFSKYINNPLHWDICLNGIRNLQNH